METPVTIPLLPHELHEWIEIQVGQEGDLFWVGGLYSQGGAKRVIYDHAHIALCPTLEEAIRLGKAIASQASVHRLLFGLPWRCKFKVEP